MQLIHDNDGSSARTIITEHDGEEIEWYLGVLAKANADLDLITFEINDYWRGLPSETQSRIFQIYKEIKNVSENTTYIPQLEKMTRKWLAELVALHPYDEMEEYVLKRSKVDYPKDLKRNYGPDAPMTPLTYLHSDYKDLVIFILMLRPLIPIWSDYIQTIKNTVGNDFKEYSAIKLIAGTALVETKAYQKLISYIGSYIENTPTPANVVFNGLGTEELPDFFSGLIIIRKLAFTEHSYTNRSGPEMNVISGIYNFLKTRINQLETTFGDSIREKRNTGRVGGSEEDNTSLAEQYKMKEEISEGHVEAYNVFIENHLGILYERYGIPDDIRAEVTNQTNVALEILSGKIKLCQHVLCRENPARVVPHLTYQSVMSLIRLTQACLWQAGLYDLAILMTSKPIKVEEEEENVYTIRVTSKGSDPVSKELSEKLEAKYHHVKNEGKRFKTFPVAKIIDVMAEELSAYHWDLQGPNKLIRLASMSVNGSVKKDCEVPRNLKNQLAEMILMFC